MANSMDNLTNTDDMNGDSAPTGQLLSHQDSAMSTDSPNGSSYTRQGSSSSSSKGNRRRSSIGSSQKSSRRGSQRLVGSAASAPPPPRYYDGDKPPGPAKYRWPTEEPQLAEARLRDGVCRVADTCGNPDTGASGCYFIFRGYPCIVTSLLQVPTPGSARQSEASFYPDDPSVGSADSRANSADVNAAAMKRAQHPMHPLQHPVHAEAPGRRPPRALRCPLRPDRLWEVHLSEGLVVVAIDASALSADSDLAAPVHVPHEHQQYVVATPAGGAKPSRLGRLRGASAGGGSSSSSSGSGTNSESATTRAATASPAALADGAGRGATTPPTTTTNGFPESLERRNQERATASKEPRVRPLVPSVNVERMKLNERWLEQPLEVVGHPLGRPKVQEQVLLRAMDARAIWFIHPAVEGLAGSGVFVHGEWVGVSVQTSLREVPRRCARIDALLSSASAMADERSVAVDNPRAFAADFNPFGDLPLLNDTPPSLAQALPPSDNMSPLESSTAATNGTHDRVRASTAPALHTKSHNSSSSSDNDNDNSASAAAAAAAGRVVARASSAIAARAAVNFPDLTPLAHGTAHGRTHANDSAWWEHGPPGSLPLALPEDLGTWAEDHTLEELKGLGTGLGSGLDHNRDKSTHWNARESQSRGLARGQIQRRALSSHRTYQGDRAAAAHASALDASAWDDKMIAAAYKAVQDDNEEALRRIVATCADAPVKEPLHGLRGGGELNWERTVGPQVVTHHRNAEGSTLLIEAATFGAYRCAGALLDLGANVGAHTLAGDTVVHRAAYHGHLSVLRVVTAFAKHLASTRITSIHQASQEATAQAAEAKKRSNSRAQNVTNRFNDKGNAFEDGVDNNDYDDGLIDKEKDSEYVNNDDGDEGRPFTPPTPPTPLYASVAHKLASRAHRHFWRAHRGEAGVTKAGGAAANSAPSDEHGTAFAAVRKHRPTPSVAAVASSGGALDVAKAVRGLLDRKNHLGVRPVEVAAKRLKLVTDFERWPQLGTRPDLSVVEKFQLTLGWFDESWGLRLDRPPPPPDPAALDPVLAFLFEPDFVPYRTQFAATPETRDLARKVVVGQATASETFIHSRPFSSANHQRGNSRNASRPASSSGGASLAPPQASSSSLESVRSGVEILSLEGESNGNAITSNITSRGNSSSGRGESRGNNRGGSSRDDRKETNNSRTKTGNGADSSRGSSRQRKRTPGPRVKRYVVTATPIYDSDSDDESK